MSRPLTLREENAIRRLKPGKYQIAPFEGAADEGVSIKINALAGKVVTFDLHGGVFTVAERPEEGIAA